MGSMTGSTTTCTIDIGDEVHLHIVEDLDDNNDDDDVEENVGRFIWPTALPMMKYIREEILPSSTEDTVVIELGAGCGLLGMGLAAHHKFHRVIITDHDDVWLQRNFHLNSNVLGLEVLCTRLDWGNADEVEAVSNMIHQTNGGIRELLIVASDVLYNHSSHRKLAYTLHKLSQDITTRILIGFMNDRGNDEVSFLAAARAREVFGTSFPSSKSIFVERKSNNRRRQIELHMIEFVVR